MISKILGMMTVGGALANAGLLHRFLSGIAGAVMLAIVGSFMLCTLMVCAVGLTYMGLVHYGLDPFVAAVVLGIIVCLLAAVVALIALNRMRLLSQHSPRSNGLDLAAITDAFIDGFLETPK